MWLSLMTRWPSSRSVRCSASPMPVRADVADVHRLGDVRRTEINDDGFWRRSFFKKQMFAARGGFERLREHGIFQPEIQEARAGDFHFFAKSSETIQALPRHQWRAGADSFCASWRATSAHCFGNRQISDRTGGLKRRRHRRPAKFRGRRLAVSIQFVCVEASLLNR